MSDWQPLYRGEYTRWELPAEKWDGAQIEEDVINIQLHQGQWLALTEKDGFIRRQLTRSEIASVRREFALDDFLPSSQAGDTE